MKLSFTTDWHTLEISANTGQNDISLAEDEHLSVIVYGYPFFCNQDNWLKADDVKSFYLQGIDDYINEIDGIYSIILVDKKVKKCKIIVDRYGVYTLYYAKKNGAFMVSESMEEIVSGWDEIVFDSGSIIEHLNFGYKLGDKTHVKGIKQFDGAHVFTIDEKLDMDTQRYWDLFEIDESNHMSKEQFRAVFNEHIRKALALGETISLPLTGGRDSRIILSACLPDKQKLHCYTHGPDHHTDIIQAKLIARHFDIPYTQYQLGDDFGKSLLDRAAGNSGFLFGHGSFFDYMHVKNSFELESKYGDLLLTGILGNQLFRHHPIGDALPVNSTREDAAALIIRQVPSVFTFRTNLLDFYDKLFKGLSGKDIYKHLSETIIKVLEKSEKAVNPLDLTRFFMFDSYCGNHASNTMRFTGKYFKLVGAFFHKDLLKQFKFVELKEMIGADLHDYIIKMNSSYLSDLKYYNSGRVVKYLKLISNKIFMKFFNKKLFKHPDFANYHMWLKKYHKNFLNNLFSYDQMVSAPMFNREAFEKIIGTYMADEVYVTNKKKMLLGFSIERFVINLVSVELWLKDFTKGKKYRFSI